MTDGSTSGQPGPAVDRRDRKVAFAVMFAGAILLLMAVHMWVAWLKPREAVLVAAPGLGLVAASFLPTRWTRRVLLAVMASGVTLLASEIALRATVGGRFAAIYRSHPTFLHELVPGARKLFRRSPINGGATVSVEINSEGFRGDELRPRGSARRVVVYGDSCVEAEFSSLENTFPKQLETALKKRLAGDVEVVNAGVVAYGPDQVALRMQAELPRLKPDLVIVVVFADNDYGDLLRNKIFSLAADGRLQRNEYRLSEAQAAAFTSARQMPYLARLAKRVWDALKAPPAGESPEPGNGLVEAWLKQCRAEYDEAVVRADRAVSGLLLDHYDADIAVTPAADSARYKRRLMEQVIAHQATLAGNENARFALLILPSRIDCCDEYSRVYIDMAAHPGYQRTALSGGIAEIAARHKIPHLNLYGPFRERGAEAHYFRGWDDHWNDAGQALAARLMADLLLEQGLIR